MEMSFVGLFQVFQRALVFSQTHVNPGEEIRCDVFLFCKLRQIIKNLYCFDFLTGVEAPADSEEIKRSRRFACAIASSISLGRRCAARSRSVRATVVVGIASVSVHSQARKVPTRWSLIRVRSGSRPVRNGVVT